MKAIQRELRDFSVAYFAVIGLVCLAFLIALVPDFIASGPALKAAASFGPPYMQ
jgi:hypothetical protein